MNWLLAAEAVDVANKTVKDSTDTLLSLGVGGVFCIMVLRLVFDFLKSRKEAQNGGGNTARLARNMNLIEILSDVKDLLTGQQQQFSTLKDKVTQIQNIAYDLQRWHDVPDPKFPGNKVWWGTGEREILDRLTQAIESLVKEVRKDGSRRGS